MKHLLLLLVVISSNNLLSRAQSYTETIRRWRQHYKEEFLTDARSPLKAKDTGYLRFYTIADHWNMRTSVSLTPEALPFDMATHSGKTKRFRKYATLKFADSRSHSARQIVLSAYERVDRPAGDTQSATTLFIPFRDLTNGTETYGGGRYMDILKADFQAGTMRLDFNKAYNPWCAFGEGFSCPIPPDENRLNVAIKAGEKLPAPPLRPKEE